MTETGLKSLVEEFRETPGTPSISQRIVRLEENQRNHGKRLHKTEKLIELIMTDRETTHNLENRVTRLEDHLFIIQQIENLQKRIRIKA